MSKFWIVFKMEYATIVKKKAFILGVLLTPLLMGAFMILPTLLAKMDVSIAESIAVIDNSEMKIGSEFIDALKEYEMDDGSGKSYSNLSLSEFGINEQENFELAKDSLTNLILIDELKFLLVVTPDSIPGAADVSMISNSDNINSINKFERELSTILSTIKLDALNINLPVDSILSLTKRMDLKIINTTGEAINPRIKMMLTVISIMILFVTIMTYGQMLMRSILDEKNSRIMEVLVSSVTPFQLMMGKIIGFGAATLTQLGIWIVVGLGFAMFMPIPENTLTSTIGLILSNPAIIIFYVLFFLSGYVLYSTIFALVGVLISSEKDAQNFIMPLSLMMMTPMMLLGYVLKEPDSTLAVVLSMIPFFAPSMMTMRLIYIVPSLSEVSLFSGIVGQAVVSLSIVVVTTIGLIWLTGKIFRVGILMHGKRATLPEIMKWVRQ